MNFFRNFSSNFWFFVAIVGKISSSSCQSRKKNSKIHWYGFFWAGLKGPGYLARARARARARPSCSTGASGPFDDRRLRSTTFRARATFKKSILSLGSFFYFCVNFILFCLNCVQMFYNLFNFSRVFNFTLCVPPGKITQSWKKTRARATFWISSSIPRGGVVVVTHYFLSFYCDSRQTSSFRSVQ